MKDVLIGFHRQNVKNLLLLFCGSLAVFESWGASTRYDVFGDKF